MRALSPALTEHERLRRELLTIAKLAGHTVPLPLPLPDGSIPDVALVDRLTESVLIGDAKNTEGPRALSPYLQLRRYYTWITSLSSDPKLRRGILAVCFSEIDEISWWVSLFSHLAYSADGNLTPPCCRSIDRHTHFVWLSSDCGDCCAYKN